MSEVVLSVVPPGVASSVADEVAVAAKGADGAGAVFVDANAISPERARAISSTVGAAGMRYVDGGIIGGPPTPERPTAVYLSGVGGDEIVELLATPEIRVEWLGPEPAAASALKMAYAGWTKGTNALVMAIRAMARAEGVEDALVHEWKRSQPAAVDWSNRAPATAGKAWRWVAEMEEIAASLETAGVPLGGVPSRRPALRAPRQLQGRRRSAAARRDDRPRPQRWEAGCMSELTMSKATREAFLADVHVGVFCVNRDGDAPLATPVWYLYEPGGDVQVIVGDSSQKAVLAKAAGRASLCAQQEGSAVSLCHRRGTDGVRHGRSRSPVPHGAALPG